MKKIVHLVPSFGCGGLEKVIVNLVNNSNNYDVRHVLISLTTEFGMIKAFDVPVDVYCLGKKPGNDIKSHIKLFKLLRRLKPVAFHTYNFGTIEYHLAAKMAFVAKTVHCDHGRGGDDPKGRNTFNNRFRKLISVFIDHYTVVSYDLLNWVTHDIGVNKNKVSLVFNGVTVPSTMPNKVAHDEWVITTVGRLDPIKNQTMLMDAFDKYSNAVKSGAVLRLVGDGPIYDELAEYKSRLSSSDNIEMLGFRSDIEAQLMNSDIFALSSHYEAMPMTILEAMALGVPVVTTDVGGISKFISEQEVWFVPANDSDAMAGAFAYLKSDDEAIRNKIERAYKLVKSTYSVEAMVDNYMKLYNVSPMR